MADVLTPEQRRKNMSRIRGRDTKPEIKLRKALWARGIRYRLYASLPGKPDLVFHGRKLVVFVDGCFWHRCPAHYTPPKSNRDFWEEKIRKNVERDERINSQLHDMGWRVLRIWEHEIKQDINGCVKKVIEA